MESSDAADPARPCSYASHVGTDLDLCAIVEVFDGQVRSLMIRNIFEGGTVAKTSFYDQHLDSLVVENF